MKFFVAFFLVTVCIAQCIGASLPGPLAENQQGFNENLESLRVRKSAKSAYAPAPSYGGSSYAPPPCPTNYLFSCGPQLQPVPCAHGGYQGAYSENIPQYAAPQYVVPPQYAYPQYAVPVITEV